MATPILENQDSLSTLIVSPVSTSSSTSSTATEFRLPPSSTRIYPYTHLPNNKGCSNFDRYYKMKRSLFGRSINSICWFSLGFGITVISLIVAWHCKLVNFNFGENNLENSLVKNQDLTKHGTVNGGVQQNVCTTPVCMMAASRLLSRYDPSADPCADFYQFSCGNFISQNEIPDDGFQRSTLQEMQESLLVQIKKLIDEPGKPTENIAIKKARQLYSSCMHSSFRTSHYSDYKFLPIFNILNAQGIGNWPILQGQSWNSSEFNLENLLAQLFIHQVQNIFKLYVSPDETDPSKYLLEFYKGEPAMTSGFYLNKTNPDYVKYLRSYKRLLLESVLILSHGKQGNPAVTSDVDDILQFETKFAHLVQNSRCHLDGYDFENNEEDYGHVTVGEIYSKIPQIDWISMIQNLFDNLDVKRRVTPEMVVYVHCSDFFHGLVTLMEQTDTRTISNYLIWRFVFRYMPFLGNKFLQIWMEFMKDVPDTNEERLHLSRWKQCVAVVNDGFGLAIANLYVQQSYDNSTEAKVKQMIYYLKKAFRQVILDQKWVPESVKDDLVEKLVYMGEKIGLPSFALNPKALAKEYDGLELGEDYFLMNILKLRKFEVRKEIKRINQAVDRDRDWIILPLVANAFHNPTANEIVIPLGILRYPMFDNNYPMYLNFANLGIVIAHEMAHGFDHLGRFYDKDGNFTSWWTDELLAAFKVQAICFTEQYAKFVMPVIEKTVDGNHTLADNVCDNAALRISWLAYQMWMKDNDAAEPELPGLNYSIPQLFFMSYGQIWCEVLNKEGYENYVRDPHSPGQFRTIGVAQNNKDFGKIFHCLRSSAMTPSLKCELWS